jgi:predicted DsbA family dithiol-disulfide isomerase
VPRQDWLTRKFGGEDRARRLHAAIADLGAAEGIEFRFRPVRRIPSAWTRTGWCAGPAGRGRWTASSLVFRTISPRAWISASHWRWRHWLAPKASTAR